MAGRRNCSREANGLDSAPPGDPKTYFGSNANLHDLRQGLVPPFTPRRTVARESVPRAARGPISRSARKALSAISSFRPIRHLGRMRKFRSQPVPKTPRADRRQKRTSTHDDLAQTQPKRSHRSGTSQTIQPEPTQPPNGQNTFAGFRVLRRLQRSQRTASLLTAGNAPFRMVQQVAQRLFSNLKSSHEDSTLGSSSRPLRYSMPSNSGEDATIMRSQVVPPSTRQMHPIPQSPPRENMPRRLSSLFPWRRVFHRPRGHLDALAGAAGRSRLEYHHRATESQEDPAAVLQRPAVLEVLKAAPKEARRQFVKLKRTVQEKLK